MNELDIARRINRGLQILLAAADADATFLADVVTACKCGVDFRDAAGLGPGWRLSIRVGIQREALAAVARVVAPGLTGRSAARAVLDAIAKYRAAHWPVGNRPPTRPAGLDGQLWDIIDAGDVPPLETLRLSFRKAIG